MKLRSVVEDLCICSSWKQIVYFRGLCSSNWSFWYPRRIHGSRKSSSTAHTPTYTFLYRGLRFHRSTKKKPLSAMVKKKKMTSCSCTAKKRDLRSRVWGSLTLLLSYFTESTIFGVALLWLCRAVVCRVAIKQDVLTRTSTIVVHGLLPQLYTRRQNAEIARQTSQHSSGLLQNARFRGCAKNLSCRRVCCFIF